VITGRVATILEGMFVSAKVSSPVAGGFGVQALAI
jgi:hypothetical protein